MSRLRAVVCGTTFGRLYAAGVRLRSSRYELAGILSRGSEQSRQFSQDQGVPLCTEIDDLPEHDMALVVVRSGVVGGDGARLAQRFLSSGKHVAMEHPIDKRDAVACYREASMAGCGFLVNTFYRHSSTIRTYLRMVEVLRARFGIIQVEAECSIHFLYSMLDIIGRIADGFTPWRVEEQGARSDVFTCLSASFRGIPVSLRVVNKMDPFNPDDFVHVGHRVTVFTAAGSLVLPETDGKIVWHPNVSSPRGPEGVLEIDADERLSLTVLHEELTVEADVMRRSLFEVVWPNAVAEFLDEAHHQLTHPEGRAREAEYTLTLCSVWAEAGKLLGPTQELRSHMSAHPLSLAQIAGEAAVDLT